MRQRTALPGTVWQVALWTLAACGGPAGFAADSPELPLQAARILDRYCHRCHRGAGSASGYEFDVRAAASMTAGDAAVVKPGSPTESPLWGLMHRGTMPPKSQIQLPRPTPAEAQVIADWIKSGASAFPVAKPREFVSLEQTLRAIRDDLQKQPDVRSRRRLRYFTLVEMHNNPSVSDESLALARAGLAKALNSLSWERELVIPRAVDLPPSRSTDASSVRAPTRAATGTDEASVLRELVYAVDIEALGWTRDHWRAIRAKYPYALGYNNLDDTKLRDIETDILRLTENAEPLYAIRADWFQAIVTQPPLYFSILFDLSLPELTKRPADPSKPGNPKRMTAVDLERYLEIDVATNIARGDERRVARAGFTASGVSGQNRLIERHVTRYGAYWKSYDFKGNNRRAILSQFPLGPVVTGQAFPALAFEHDGGEVVFHLPNGLQGYLLMDGRDNRIDAGPIEVVSDALKTSGTPAIVNGLSCMACHKHGMIEPPDDEIRKFARVFGRERDQVQRLYPETAVFQTKVEADRKQFLKSLEVVIGPFLRRGEEAQRPLEEFPEPVSEVARGYILEELDLAAVAAELHEPDVQRLRVKLENDELLKGLGLGVLLRENGKIKRAFWDGNSDGNSVMQLTGSSLDYSTPRYGN